MSEDNKKNVFLSGQYGFSFVLWVSGLTALFFSFFGIVLFVLLNRRLGIDYLTDITTLSHLQEKLPVILTVTGIVQATVASLVVFVITLFLAHAVAGPLVRFRRYLGMVVQNKPIDETVAFRSGDQLHDLARAFDEMQKASRQRKKQFSGFCQETRDMIGGYDRLSKDPQVSASILEEKRQAIKRSYQKILALFQNKESL